jgi:saccharopine dehydrogenase (NAD+, L-glutamate forming)
VDRSSDRPFDVVVVGATGFTGRLTAEHLARHAPAGTRWAIAGRNPDKLAATSASLLASGATHEEVPTLRVDATDTGSLRGLAEQARVVATTVGPFIHHGEGLVAACAAAGTDYLDITGEPEFVDRTYVRHHATAARTGARLVHCCGFDSIPHDLGAWFTVQHLPEGVPLSIDGYVRAGGRPSGGTVHSAIHALSRLREAAREAKARAAVEPPSDGRRVRAGAGRPGRHGGWALPMPTVDPQIVGRSARALTRYGPDFTYRHHVVMNGLGAAAGLAVGAPALVALAQLPPAKRFLLGRTASGDGPTDRQRDAGWFSVTFDGRGGGRQVRTEVAGGDPGYTETAKMLGESALSLAFDDLPVSAGQVTTAVALGDALVARLQQVGISFRVVADDLAP